MKLKKIIMPVLFSAVLFSCSRDYSVEKNLDVSWEIDKAIVNDDIRERIGYDPRFTYPYILQNEKIVDVLAINGQEVNNTYTAEVTVSLSKTIKEDVGVALEYSADVFDKINHEGFQLIDPSKITIDQTNKVISQGETSVKFTFSYTQQGELSQNVIAPFVLKYTGSNDRVKTLESANTYVLKIQKKNIEFSLNPTQITQYARYRNGQLLMQPRFTFDISTQENLPFAIEFNLTRDASFTAPAGKTLLEANRITLPQAQTLTNENKTLTFSFDVNATGLSQTTYATQFIVGATVGNQRFSLTEKVPAELIVTEGGLNNTGRNVSLVGLEKASELREISKNSGIAVEGDDQGFVQDAPSLIDGQTNDWDVFYDTTSSKAEIKITFTGEKTIKGIRLVGTSIKSFDVFASSLTESDVLQGKVTYNGRDVIILFTEPITVSALTLKNFTSSGAYGEYVIFSELFFYSE